MKKLTNISPYTWAAITIALLISVIFTIFLLTYKVERTIETTVHVKGATRSIFVNSSDAYLISKNNLINIRINNNYHSAYISDVIYDESTKLYKIKLQGLNISLLPNSILKATIILDVQRLGSFLFS